MTRESRMRPPVSRDAACLDPIVLLLLLVGAGFGYCFPPVNIDEGAIFDFARRMLDGKVLYGDLIDVNPPMIFLLNLLPAYIAEHTSLTAPAIITACVLILPILSLRSLYAFLALTSDSPGARRVIMLAAVYLLILYPGAEFSQREHLLLLTAIPYLYNVHAFIAPQGRRSIAVRLLEIVPLALMVCQKPYFILIPALLELVALHESRGSRRPSRRPELAILLGICGLYLLATCLIFPAYLLRIVPLADHLYGIADRGMMTIGFFGGEGRQLLLAILLLGAVYAFFLRQLWLKLLIVCIIACYLESALQLKDWSYHFLPARALTILAVVASAAAVLADRLRARASPIGRRWSEVTVLPLLLLLSLPEMLEAGPQAVLPLPYPAQRAFEDDGWAHVREIVAQHARGSTVMWLSQYNEGSADALAYSRAELISPTMSLWMLPGLYEPHEVRGGGVVFHDPQHMSADEKWLWDAVSDVFFKVSPPVVVDVTEDPGLRPGHFDYVEYFSTNPKFRLRFASYRKVYENAVARVYVRIPETRHMANNG